MLTLFLLATPLNTYAGPREFTLTLDQARNRAIQNSTTLRNLQENRVITDAEEQRAREGFATGAFGFNMTEFVTLQSDLMRIRAQRAADIQNADIKRDTLGLIVAHQFASILMAENELRLFDENMALLTREMEILKTRIDLGLASELELTFAQLNMDRLGQDRKSLELALAQAHVELNRIIGTPEDRVHQLIFDIKFEELNVVNLPGHISHQTNNNAALVQARAESDAARFQLDNHTTPFDPQTGMVIPGTASRREYQIHFTMATRDARQTRLSIEDHIINTYHRIRNMEISINNLYLQLDTLHYRLSLLEVELGLGQITPLEIDKINLEILNLEENIRRQEVNHSLLTIEFWNPAIDM